MRKQATRHRGPYHRYTDFKLVHSNLGDTAEEEAIKEELKDPNSETRKIIREDFEFAPLGKHSIIINVWGTKSKHPSMAAYYEVEFTKIR